MQNQRTVGSATMGKKETVAAECRIAIRDVAVATESTNNHRHQSKLSWLQVTKIIEIKLTRKRDRKKIVQ